MWFKIFIPLVQNINTIGSKVLHWWFKKQFAPHAPHHKSAPHRKVPLYIYISIGYQPVFYQKCWNIVGEKVIGCIREFFATNSLPAELNENLVVLLRKVDRPETMSGFRPISLCNVVYKAITKTLVSRLQPILMKMVGPTQGSFIPGRLIEDNVVIACPRDHSLYDEEESGEKIDDD